MKMKHTFIEVPRFVKIKEELLNELSKLCEEFSFKEIFFLSGRNTYKMLGKSVEEALATDYVVQRAIIENSNISTFEKLKTEMEQREFDLVVGVGGGKIANIGKLLASDASIPYIYIPTTASNDGIASPIATLWDRGRPRSLSARAPTAILVDIEVIKKSPGRLLNAGVGDLISNTVANKDWILGHEKKGEDFNEVASALAVIPVELILSRASTFDLGKDEDLMLLIRGLILSGMAMAMHGSSRPASGAAHKFSHAIDLLNLGRGYHGEQVGIGAILMEHLYEKYHDSGNPNAVRSLLKRIGAPTALVGIGMSRKDFLKIAAKIREIRPYRYTILEDLNLGKKELLQAARESGIIK